MIKNVPLRVLLAALIGGCFLAYGSDAAPASAAANVRFSCSPGVQCIKPVDCTGDPEIHDPGLWDQITLENHGDAPQDLTGWVLKSDPEDTQVMPLDVAGTLTPFVNPDEDRVFIVAGQHSNDYPARKTYRWSPLEVLRDSGEPADYVRLYDPAGNLVDSMDCNGNPVPLASQQQAATPTPAPQTGAVNTDSGGSTEAQAQNTTGTQSAATGSQAASNQNAAAAPPGAPGGGVPGPNSGIGSLAVSGTTPSRLAFGALALGLAGVLTSALVLLRKRGSSR